MQTTTKKIDAGFYQIQCAGRTFTAETVARASEGQSDERAWILKETTGGADDYWTHEPTLRDAKLAITEVIEHGHL